MVAAEPPGLDDEAAFETGLEELLKHDADGNRTVERAEVEKDTGGLLPAMFEQWDANGDGVATREEIQESMRFYGAPVVRRRFPYLASWRSGAAHRGAMTLDVQDHGDSLFAALDLNGDQTLGQREIRLAAKTLEQLDRDKDGQIASSELPRTLRVVVGRELGPSQLPFAISMSTRGALQIVRGAPKWFVAMDRNRDGDLGVEEFVGSSNRFQQIDRNRDGLISGAEARNAAGQEDMPPG